MFIPLLSAVLSFLLVCELPMFSFKFHRDDTKVLKLKRLLYVLLLLVCAVVILAFRVHWSAIVLCAVVFYILKNIVYYFAKL